MGGPILGAFVAGVDGCMTPATGESRDLESHLPTDGARMTGFPAAAQISAYRWLRARGRGAADARPQPLADLAGGQ
ncbi:MAG: hypothetical protein ACE5FL_15820, partial [Myxococcota bacterium]